MSSLGTVSNSGKDYTCQNWHSLAWQKGAGGFNTYFETRLTSIPVAATVEADMSPLRRQEGGELRMGSPIESKIRIGGYPRIVQSVNQQSWHANAAEQRGG